MSDPTAETSATTPPSGVDAWERAYLRFETPREEQRKFTTRLRSAGANTWRRDAVVLDLFSGRGGCADALRAMGFQRVISLDLSPALLRARADTSGCAVTDCRCLPIANQSVDIATVHGGLHHLAQLPDDLASTLREVARVLRPDGVFVAVEPWRTPFLDAVHWVCRSRWARKAFGKIDSLATMIELERSTYEQWLASDRPILATFEHHFRPVQRRVRMGKLHFVGSPRRT